MDSGFTEVSCFDGLFNTGTAVHVMPMVLPGRRFLPGHIPSFCSMMCNEWTTDWSLESAIETARLVMNRRARESSPAAERLLQVILE